MPYEREVASGDSLIWLKNSEVLREFKGIIQRREEIPQFPPPLLTDIKRIGWWPRRVIAVDGSNIVQRVNNGFPGAEAGLMMVSVVSIKLEMLRAIAPGTIPSPAIFHNMENACTLEAAVPGIGVVRRDVKNDSPKEFFRHCVYEVLSGTVAGNHESLLETLRAIDEKRKIEIPCPIDGCSEHFVRQQGKYCCNCQRHETMFETDALRLHQYFQDIGGSGEAHGRLRDVLELLVLLNILRFFAEKEPAYLADCAFVLDGPLAVFGAPASILRSVRNEFVRLNEKARSFNKQDIVVFGIEKSGRFFEHWEEIDWDDEKGPRRRFPTGTVLALDNDYISRNIVASSAKSKPYGEDTYYGRKVFYKTQKEEHVVLNTAMLNTTAQDFNRNDMKCYPRLGDILDVMDQLATHLYRDGFMPLTRAHAHAAIPLKRGADIIKSLLEDSA